jgi:hypothetical protein
VTHGWLIRVTDVVRRHWSIKSLDPGVRLVANVACLLLPLGRGKLRGLRNSDFVLPMLTTTHPSVLLNLDIFFLLASIVKPSHELFNRPDVDIPFYSIRRSLLFDFRLERAFLKSFKLFIILLLLKLYGHQAYFSFCCLPTSET